MEIIEKYRETSEGPRELTPQNVQYFSSHTSQFAQTQVHKAKKFLEHNCLKYDGNGVFLCLPISGYNKRIYTMKKAGDEFTCTCQYFVTKGQMCSHILSLYYFLKLKPFRK